MPKHDEAEAPRVCVDCGAVAPKTETDYTLISAKHGWRLARIVDPQRGVVLDWRCPECWERHKAARAAAGAPPSSPRPTTSTRANEPPSTRVQPASKASLPPSAPRSTTSKPSRPPSTPPSTMRSWAPPAKPRTPR